MPSVCGSCRNDPVFDVKIGSAAAAPPISRVNAAKAKLGSVSRKLK